MIRTLLLLCTLLLLQGCIPKRPAHTIDHYTLALPDIQPLSHRSDPRTVKIMMLRSDAPYRLDRIYYSTAPTRIEPYAYSRWSDTPVAMTERYLEHALRVRRLFRTVLPSTSDADTDLLLECELLRFLQIVPPDTPSYAQIVMPCTLIDTRQRRPIASTELHAKSPAPRKDPSGGVEALQKAMQGIVEQLFAWLVPLIEQ